MSKLSKIKQTKQAKIDYAHPIIDILAQRCSKQDVMDVLHCSEREARMLISECAMHYPVISYSKNGVGYRRAKPIDSLSNEELALETLEIENTIKDTSSRIKCLKKRLKPLIAWLKVARNKLQNIKMEEI